MNVNIGDISYLSFAFLLYAHFRYIFYNHFTAISFFFTYIKIIIQECVKRVKNREEKNTHILSSFMVERIYVSSIVAVFSNEKEERTDFLRIFQKVVPFQKVEAREIFMFIVSSSMARKGTQLIPKSKRHERDNAVIRVFHTL